METFVKVNHSRHAAIYDAVARMKVGTELQFHLSPEEWKGVANHIRNRARSGAYGEDVGIRTRSRSVVKFAVEKKLLYVRKVMKS